MSSENTLLVQTVGAPQTKAVDPSWGRFKIRWIGEGAAFSLSSLIAIKGCLMSHSSDMPADDALRWGISYYTYSVAIQSMYILTDRTHPLWGNKEKKIKAALMSTYWVGLLGMAATNLNQG